MQLLLRVQRGRKPPEAEPRSSGAEALARVWHHAQGRWGTRFTH
eukprot:CAMPEP_0204516388 /NCGR_PEP_ID=MMETSP0661-20131031/3118_1 /ASSEMBLY_ACC=CAM_ASM_000606 /TAXON_ID=109239 /ORGANISM="Alexandrium margalefi, Strain AMGDE01CS-322" /LENGTH=43 /DNA_ID= /DNA_START= /DNA_END= /DNA_ORIENTATION=